MKNLDPPVPPPPQIKDGKMARFWPSRGFILDLGGRGFAVPFYVVQDCSWFAHLSRYSPFFPNKEPGRFQSKRTKEVTPWIVFIQKLSTCCLRQLIWIRLKSLISDPRCVLQCLPIKFDSLTSFHFLVAWLLTIKCLRTDIFMKNDHSFNLQ